MGIVKQSSKRTAGSRTVKKNRKTIKNKSIGGTPKKSRRDLSPVLITREIGNTTRNVSDNILIENAGKIRPGLQIVSLPATEKGNPQRHAFAVALLPETEEIKISDWGGAINLEKGDKKKNGTFGQYSKFIHMINDRYPDYTIVYYPVDEELECKADEYHAQRDFGGCSYYIYRWVDKHRDTLPAYAE